MRKLFDGQASNATSSEITWLGGEGSMYVEGNIGGGTLKLMTRLHGPTLFSVGENTELTAVGVGNFKLPSGAILAVELSGATSPDLTVSIGGNENE
jgi:hypothetical protein